MEYENFIVMPSIDRLQGIRVTKETNIEYTNENVKQTIKGLVLESELTVVGDKYKSTYNTTIELEEGDVLIFEGEGRGYIKPVENFVTVEEAIKELEYIK